MNKPILSRTTDALCVALFNLSLLYQPIQLFAPSKKLLTYSRRVQPWVEQLSLEKRARPRVI
jgi:hypothetical protein